MWGGETKQDRYAAESIKVFLTFDAHLKQMSADLFSIAPIFF
jgi:hypothetical protein